jgi:ribosomal protein S18 acetylase RimI-like enzyme
LPAPSPRPVVAEAADVILRDGTTLRLRAPGRDDLDALVAFFAGLSDQSRYLRFHGAVRPEPRLVEPFVEPDWMERGALVGVLDDRVVALASWARLRDPSAAEVAFVVADELHGRGLGTRLLEQLAARAGAVGIESFLAEVLPENRAMLDVFEHVGFEVVRELESGTVEVRFPIAPPSASRQGSTSATTSGSSPRCGPSSSRGPSPCSAPRPGAGRSEGSSSATSSPRTSPASLTR